MNKKIELRTIGNAIGILVFVIAVIVSIGIVSAQPTPLTVQHVWTEDASGNSKTAFAPGDTIVFKAELNNPYGGMLRGATGARLGITTNPSFFSDTTDTFPPGKPTDIPAGVSTWTWKATAPSGLGEYTVTVKAYDSFAGALPEGSASFTITSGLTPTPTPTPTITQEQTPENCVALEGFNCSTPTPTPTPTPTVTPTPTLTAILTPTSTVIATPAPSTPPKFFCIVGPGGTPGPECVTPTPTEATPVPPTLTPQPNIFYPGIKWETKDLNDLTQNANQLDSTLIHSYENTDAISGAFNVWLAYNGIPTKENYIDNTTGDGNYPIAFAHSGGTRTLINKIKDGKVTADYVVLAAPAMIKKEELEGLIKDAKIKKKVIIFQSEKDLLYQFKVRVEKKHVSSVDGLVWSPSHILQWRTPKIKTPDIKIPGMEIPEIKTPDIKIPGIKIPGAEIPEIKIPGTKIPETKTPDIKIPGVGLPEDEFPAVTILSDIKIKDLDIAILGIKITSSKSLNGWVIDATDLFKSSNLDPNDKRIPDDETFWIGGANRKKQELFTNWSLNNDENLNIISIDLTNDPLLNGMNYGEVHGALKDKMIERFQNKEYPFNGTFEGLEKVN